jgi:hypothetical protein
VNTTLDAPAADRLAKILGLLGSDHSGERDAAAQAADKLVRGLGLSWADVIRAPPAVPREHCSRFDAAADERSAIWFAFHHRYSLTPRDRQFVEGLTQWRRPLSAKQSKWLDDICGKLAEATA